MRSRNRRRRGNFSVARFFLKLSGLAKWGRLKRIRTLEWLSEENNQKKARGATVCGQLCMDNISNGLNESGDFVNIVLIRRVSVNIPVIAVKFRNFIRNLSFLFPWIFCPPYTIAIASSSRRTFASSLLDVFSFVLRCFRFFELVHGFNVVYVYLWLNRVTPNTKNAG